MIEIEHEKKVIQFSYSEMGKRHEELNLENQDHKLNRITFYFAFLTTC